MESQAQRPGWGRGFAGTWVKRDLESERRDEMARDDSEHHDAR